MLGGNSAAERYADLLVKDVDSELKDDKFLTRAVLRCLCTEVNGMHIDVISGYLNVDKKDVEDAIKSLGKLSLVNAHDKNAPPGYVYQTTDGELYNKIKISKEFSVCALNWGNLNKDEFKDILIRLNSGIGGFQIEYFKPFNVKSDSLDPLCKSVRKELEKINRMEQSYISNLVGHPNVSHFGIQTAVFYDPTVDRDGVPRKSIDIEASMNYASLEEAIKDGPNIIRGKLIDRHNEFFEIDKGYHPVMLIGKNYGNLNVQNIALRIGTSIGSGSDAWRRHLEYQKKLCVEVIQSVAPVRDLYTEKRVS